MKKVSVLIVLLTFGIYSFSQTSTLNRPNDPVVLTGTQLTAFSSLNPNQIVGFKFVAGSWTQIPVQVDERALLDIVTPYGPLASGSGYPPSPSNPKLIFYCDTTTHIGADTTTTFDSDDELVFMAKDAGGQSNGTYPVGVVNGSCQQVIITDPLGGLGYVYLFQHDGTLQSGAGISYVTYSSNLSTTTGFPANAGTTNTENTTISTSKYSWHFAAEWVSDQFKLLIGNNTDILDRYKNFFFNGYCGRHEDTFSAAENAFICVKAGPVRVIRSYMGANSGPLTQRTHWFYEGRQDIATDLRVHSIPSAFDVFDYNSAANGMVYRNNLNTAGVTINGQQDTPNAGLPVWEQVSGTPGTISIIYKQNTTYAAGEATFTGYYDDNSTTPASNCTGDGQAWGASGIGMLFTGNECTDPLNSNCSAAELRTVQFTRTIYADSANAAATTAATYYTQSISPFVVAVSACQAAATYTVTTLANPVAGGTTTGDGTYASGASVTVTATANNGYVFTNWTDGGNVVSTSSSYTFNAFANTTLVANFAISTTNYTVTTTSNPIAGGSTTGAATYAAGISVTVTATADSGYTFTNWTENGTVVSTNASYAFTISSDRSLTANFDLIPTYYTATLSANPSNGGITTGQGTYAQGTTVALTAEALTGYSFVNWTENSTEVSTDSAYTFTLTTDRDLVANFELTIGVGREPQQNEISVYPNPNNGSIYLTLLGSYDLKVLNALGQVVLSTQLNATQHHIELAEQGVYILQFTDTQGSRLNKRVVVQR